MIRSVTGIWEVRDLSGALLDISQSQSQGLQEAINYAHNNNRCLLVIGGGQTTDGSDPNSIISDMPIYIPAGSKGCYTFKGVTLWFRGATGNNTLGIVFDSMDMMDFDFGGQIVYPGIASAVTFMARTPFREGLDSFTVVTSSRVRIQTIAIVDPTGVPIPSGGTALAIVNAPPVTFLDLDVAEINGGIRPIWTDGLAYFAWNHIKLLGVHNVGGPPVIQGGPGPNRIDIFGPN